MPKKVNKNLSLQQTDKHKKRRHNHRHSRLRGLENRALPCPGHSAGTHEPSVERVGDGAPRIAQYPRTPPPPAASVESGCRPALPARSPGGLPGRSCRSGSGAGSRRGPGAAASSTRTRHRTPRRATGIPVSETSSPGRWRVRHARSSPRESPLCGRRSFTLAEAARARLPISCKDGLLLPRDAFVCLSRGGTAPTPARKRSN